MNLKVYPGELRGTVNAPSSKSLTHRLLIASFLRNERIEINNYLECDDSLATIGILEDLGAMITRQNNKIIVDKRNEIKRFIFNANASGSTARFMIPIISLFSNDFKVVGVPKLYERLDTADLTDLQGLDISFDDGIKVCGSLNADKYYLSTTNTTQFISGMIFCLPFIKANELIIDGDISNSYIHMTIDAMEQLGFHYEIVDNRIIYIEKTKKTLSKLWVEGDYSNASYLMNMRLLNSGVIIDNLNPESLQGDKIYEDFLELYLQGQCTFDLTSCPDLGPALFAICAVGNSIIKITGIDKLFIKESDRVNSMIKVLKELGSDIKLDGDAVVINGRDFLNGDCIVDSFDDHRIVMSLISIASRVKKPFVITRAEAINKSYPNFIKDYVSLLGKVEEVK